MKISKLFHWLYAFIMLMPVFFIAGRVAYVTFNKNAKDSYSGTYGITYKYESNEVNNEVDLITGNIYHFTTDENNKLYDLIQNGFLKVKIVKINHFYYNTVENSYIDEVMTNYDGNIEYETYLTFSNGQIDYLTPSDNNYVYSVVEYSGTVYIDMIVEYKQSLDLEVEHISNYFTYTDYNEIESIDTSGTLDNAFEYSVNQLNEVPLFSWAQTSFLVAPFSYITGLFGVSSGSPINTLLSYWLSISIIWLVFDLVMYLPLLIHRWLDKGVLE